MTHRELSEVFSTLLLGCSVRAGDRGAVKVQVVSSDADRSQVARLRAEHGGSGLIATGLDEVDVAATLLLATVGGRAVGTVRIVSGEPAQLPYLKRFPELIPLFPSGARYLELSRLVVAQDQRYFGVSFALGLAVLEELSRSGADGAISVCMDHLVPYYVKIGFRQVARDEVRSPLGNLLVLDDAAFPVLTAIKSLLTAVARVPGSVLARATASARQVTGVPESWPEWPTSTGYR